MVVDFFASNSAEYELRAQLCTDLVTMPVEDASVLWPDTAPHQRIAKITFPAQDAYSAARRAYADDVLSFNPWHALAVKDDPIVFRAAPGDVVDGVLPRAT